MSGGARSLFPFAVRLSPLVTFRVIMANEWSSFLAYRVVFFLYALYSVITPLVFLSVWGTLAGGEGIAGWSRGEFVAYYLAFMVVNLLAGSIEIHTTGWEIQSGDLSPRLLMPIHPGVRAVAANISFKAVGLVVVVPSVLLLGALFGPELHTSPEMLALGVFAILPAAALQFLLGYSIALLAFWTTRADAITGLNNALLFLLSGEVAPISLLPEWLRSVATVLPHRYMLSFPIELITGRLSWGAAALGLGMQAVWLVVAWFVMRTTWRRGVRRYSAVGG